MKDDIDIADFNNILNEQKQEKEPLFDFNNDLRKEYKITKDLGYYNKRIVLAEYKEFVAVLGSKKTILLINRNYPNLEHHSHIRLRTNKSGEIVLSTVYYIFDCIKKHTYPKSNYVFICIIRLLDDDNDYKQWLLYKKEKNKNKLKYINNGGKKK